ncbi:MAG: universal stress protein [Candidatus Thermoplasmatota archaeon]|nr:universal stress protein [Candidatus Thermoplasmatota archaeon]
MATTPITRATPKRGAELISHVVLPVEGGSEELVVQQWAVEMAAALGVPLRAVHVNTDGEDPPPDVFTFLSEMASERKVELETHIIHGRHVADELADELAPTDLVVIGTRLLGTGDSWSSTTEGLIRRAPCPVQVLRMA